MPDGRYHDPDPPPRRSPRLVADVGRLPGAVPTSRARASGPTPAQLDRLRRDIAIYAAIQAGMSQRLAGKTFKLSQPGISKAYRRIVCRNSRV